MDPYQIINWVTPGRRRRSRLLWAGVVKKRTYLLFFFFDIKVDTSADHFLQRDARRLVFLRIDFDSRLSAAL